MLNILSLSITIWRSSKWWSFEESKEADRDWYRERYDDIVELRNDVMGTERFIADYAAEW